MTQHDKKAEQAQTVFPGRQHTPSTPQWETLTTLAESVRREAPWSWMADTDLFAVRAPKSGQTYYCCFLGQAGAFFGLCAYRGDRGLLNCILAEKECASTLEFVFTRDDLLLSFGTRDDLAEDDRALYGALGRDFGTKNHWPTFRSHLPLLPDSRLTAHEADDLIDVLSQALEVAQIYKHERETLAFPTDQHLLLRHIDAEAGDAWRNDWVEGRVRDAAAVLAPKMRVERPLFEAVKGLTASEETWLVDAVETPIVIKEDPRNPIRPLVLVAFEEKMELVRSAEVIPPAENLPQEVTSHLLRTVARHGSVPREVVIRSRYLGMLLEPVMRSLDIELSIDEAPDAPLNALVGRFLRTAFGGN